ncbi:hypothetical protein GOP47_0009666 [Adiantum capillus-veneris]|uniref:J domain-containing protein n=1 Tax=Adiantum capillus-veneris TaxID=13818 RepID=A0A9D4UXF4_ADICA|nr:hypothetical protein GOP47_0009666 [Adiantum capillus-veneris]
MAASPIVIPSAPLSMRHRHSLRTASPPSSTSLTARMSSGCYAVSSLSPFTQQDPYTTLGLSNDASADEIKKARRRLALKFHPDVCKSESCTEKFIQVEQAYETIMDCLRGKESSFSVDAPEGMMGVYDESWEDWEEWMGWEGAGTRDYSTHINHSL